MTYLKEITTREGLRASAAILTRSAQAAQLPAQGSHASANLKPPGHGANRDATGTHASNTGG